MENFNGYDYFIKKCNIDAGNGDSLMFISANEKITYREFDNKISNKYNNFFKEISDCSVAGILLQDSLIQQIIYWGAMKNGMTPALFSYSEPVESIVSVINSAHMDMLVITSDKRSIADEIISKCFMKRIYIVENNDTISLYHYDPNIRSVEERNRLILFSSGTTGVSKGIIHDQEDMKFAAETYGKQILKLTSDDIMYSMSHLNYGFAFTNSTFQTFYGGAASIIDKSTEIWTIIENINKLRPTVICGVPAIYEALMSISDRANINFSFVRLVLSSGEKLPTKILNAWYEKFGLPIIEGYGSVEMLTNVVSNSLECYKFGASGKIIEGFEFEFEDHPIGENGGILSVSGGSISNISIVSDENKSKKYFTKDVFSIDKDGFLWYNGRADNIYKVNGVWFDPHCIEELLENEPHIINAVVLNDNMKLTAYIVMYDMDMFCYDYLKDLNYRLKQENSQPFCPNKYVAVKELPRNANEKKLRNSIPQELILNELEA